MSTKKVASQPAVSRSSPGIPEHERAAAGSVLQVARASEYFPFLLRRRPRVMSERNAPYAFLSGARRTEPGFFEMRFRSEDQLEARSLRRLVRAHRPASEHSS
jgi:hypothetical protein